MKTLYLCLITVIVVAVIGSAGRAVFNGQSPDMSQTKGSSQVSGLLVAAEQPIIGTDYRKLSLLGNMQIYRCPLAVEGCDTAMAGKQAGMLITTSYDKQANVTENLVKTITLSAPAPASYLSPIHSG